jgi:hypothetical protein
MQFPVINLTVAVETEMPSVVYSRRIFIHTGSSKWQSTIDGGSLQERLFRFLPAQYLHLQLV